MAKTESLPAVPAPVVSPAASRQMIPASPQPQIRPANVQVRSVFDVAPAPISAARKKAEETRRGLSAGLQSLRNAAKLSADAQQAIAADASQVVVFAHEGLTPELLKQFSDLAEPLIKAFTAAQ